MFKKISIIMIFALLFSQRSIAQNNRIKIKSLTLYRNKMVLVANGEFDTPIATFSVSCNKKRTPIGTRYIKEKIRWHKLYGDENYAQYCLRYGDSDNNEPLLLHSIIYSEKYNPFSLKNFTNYYGWTYNTYNGIMYEINSGGCVRLRVGDVKWLYDNIEYNTPFNIIDTDEKIIRPQFEEIPADATFDPTDLEAIYLATNNYDKDSIIQYEKGELKIDFN